MLRWGFSNNEKANASWHFAGPGDNERIKDALEFIKEKDIQSYESIIDAVEKNLAEKDKITAYIDNAVIVAPVLRAVVEKTNSKYEVEGETNGLPVLQRMICYDKTISVDGRYKIIDSTCFLLTPNVETLIFEEGVEYINASVLRESKTLKKLVFPHSMRYIGEYAFHSCPNLSSIEFKNPDTKYYEDTFSGSIWEKEYDHKLKDKLIDLLNNFNATEINEYFSGGEFVDDCDKYYERNTSTYVLDQLTNAFYTIDVDYRDTDKFSDMVKEALEEALRML